MYAKYSKQEKIDMIMECRSSGLSDYQWCKQHGISASSFYNWTVQLKKLGAELPAPTDRESFSPVSNQDIVKLDIVDDISLPSNPNPIPNLAPAVEIVVGKATIKISNDISPELLSKLMSCIGGCL